MTYADAQIGRVLNALDQFELASETLIVLWGDHGFHLGDLGSGPNTLITSKPTGFPSSFLHRSHAGSATKTHGKRRIFPTLNELAESPSKALKP